MPFPSFASFEKADLMNGFELVMGAVFLGLVGFQVWLSARVYRSDQYERQQKVWQMQLIWLLPILGAGLVFYMLSDQEPKRTPSSSTRQGS